MQFANEQSGCVTWLSEFVAIRLRHFVEFYLSFLSFIVSNKKMLKYGVKGFGTTETTLRVENK
jgi:hypothetical protein